MLSNRDTTWPMLINMSSKYPKRTAGVDCCANSPQDMFLCDIRLGSLPRVHSDTIEGEGILHHLLTFFIHVWAVLLVYSADIQFLHQSTGRLPVTGGSNDHG